MAYLRTILYVAQICNPTQLQILLAHLKFLGEWQPAIITLYVSQQFDFILNFVEIL